MKNTDEALAKILDSLADKFGTTVNHLYAIMIKQAYIDGIECIAGILITSLIAVILGVWCYRVSKKEKRHFDDYIMLYVGSTIFFVIAFITLLVAGSTAIDALCNPECYALHQIIK